MRRSRPRSTIPLAVAAFAGAVVLTTAVAGALSGAPDGRRGTDPLSAAEVASATRAASAVRGTSRTGVVLRIERHDEGKLHRGTAAELRRADVFTYNYANDALTRMLVDVSTGRVDGTEVSHGVQLPLAPSERTRAVELMLADPATLARLRAAYQASTGRVLVDPQHALIADPIVFRADSMPNAAHGELAACGLHRCGQLMLQSVDHVLINLLPVVDLSREHMLDSRAFDGGR
jgi:hypothetical protein